jgi:hypothetical protein
MNSIKEEKVGSISGLINIVSNHICENNRILWFRGHLDSNWALIPSIYRGYTNDAERNFVHRFRARAYSRAENMPSYEERAKWLSLMQHYELPTRLLDWTRSPLIALFFALEKYIYKDFDKEIDACVWMLEPHELNDREELGKLTPSIESLTCIELINPAFDDKDNECNKVMAVMASECDMRMFVQQGGFTIHARSEPLTESADSMKYLTKLIIPKDSVEELADKIDRCGFRRGDLFPDLINLSKELKGTYRPNY